MNDNSILVILLIFFVVILIVTVGVLTVIRKVSRGVRSAKRKIIQINNTVSDIQDIAEMVSGIGQMPHTVTRVTKVVRTSNGALPEEFSEIFSSQNFAPQKKTVGGATNVYLPIIQKDFPEFHASNAESDIKSVMRDYVKCIHSGETTFESRAINKNVVSNIIPKNKGTVTDLIFHQIAIYNYQKTVDYATVIYRISFGYKINGIPIETRYEIHYTLQLREQGTASKALRCANCNAPLDTVTHLSSCPYCEAKIIRDTIMSWIVSDIRELD